MTARKKKKPSVSVRLSEVAQGVAQQRGMTTKPAAATKSGKLLWKLLEDALPSVRTSAAFALTRARDPALVQAFIAALKGASSARMAKSAVLLGAAGYVNAVPYFAAGLQEALKTDKKLAGALARGLGLLADPSVAPLLIEALESNTVPMEAAEALGRLGDVRAAPALIKALGHKNESVRAAAAYSLGCLGQL
ncbi:MAG: HEAT repeat domain-containing protein, partial [Myxococcaceae bacterium]|nr:HEAT repeat domain-containing protein [Myxococcaceae bacterium]